MPPNQQIIKQRSIDINLLQDMAAFYGDKFSLSPLASKIYTFLMFDFDRAGITFDELLEFFKVSKSSLSNSLNALVTNNLIEFVTSFDSRKRLFRINEKYAYNRFNELLLNLNKEKELLNRFIKSNDLSINKNTMDGLTVYTQILEEHIETIADTIEKLK